MSENINALFQQLKAFKRARPDTDYPFKAYISIATRYVAVLGVASYAIALFLVLLVVNNPELETLKLITIIIACVTLLAGVVIMLLIIIDGVMLIYHGWRSSHCDVLHSGSINDRYAKTLTEYDLQTLGKAKTWLQCEIDEHNRHRNLFFGGAVSLFGVFELLIKNTDIDYRTLWNFSGRLSDFGFSQLVAAIQFFMIGAVVGGFMRMHLTNRLERQKMWVELALNIKNKEQYDTNEHCGQK